MSITLKLSITLPKMSNNTTINPSTTYCIFSLLLFINSLYSFFCDNTTITQIANEIITKYTFFYDNLHHFDKKRNKL